MSVLFDLSLDIKLIGLNYSEGSQMQISMCTNFKIRSVSSIIRPPAYTVLKSTLENKFANLCVCVCVYIYIYISHTHKFTYLRSIVSSSESDVKSEGMDCYQQVIDHIKVIYSIK